MKFKSIVYIHVVLVCIGLVTLALSLFLYQKTQGARISLKRETTKVIKTNSQTCKTFELSTDSLKPENTKITCTLANGEVQTIAIPDLSSHYHNNEVIGDSIYVIRQVGYDGYPDDDWNHELWKYSKDGAATKLYAHQGMDFRVSPNNKLIALEVEPDLHIMSTTGEILKTVQLADLQLPAEDDYWVTENAVTLDSITNDSIWLAQNSLGPYKIGYIEINLSSYQNNKYRLPKTINEFSEGVLNPNAGLVAFSDYPALYDETTAEEFKQSKAKTTLKVLNLKTSQITNVANGVTHMFKPKWLDGNTLEYQDFDDNKKTIVKF